MLRNSKYSEDFLKQVSMMFFDRFYRIIRIDEAMIFLECNTGSYIIDNTLKLLVLLGKFLIHKAKKGLTPSFNFFCKDVKIFHDSLNSITRNKKCIKTSLESLKNSLESNVLLCTM